MKSSTIGFGDTPVQMLDNGTIATQLPAAAFGTVVAPPGALGLKIGTHADGHACILEVESGSPLAGKVGIGDGVMEVDGDDTAQHTHEELVAYLATKPGDAKTLRMRAPLHTVVGNECAERHHRSDPRPQASSVPACVRLLLSPRPRAEAALLGLSLADERALQEKPLKRSEAIAAALKVAEGIKAAEGTGEYLVQVGVAPARRHTLDLGGYFAAPARRPPLTLFHELRGFYDQGYRLHCVRTALQRTMRARDWGCQQLFDSIDADGDGCIDARELRGALEATGIRVRAMELDALVEVCVEMTGRPGSGSLHNNERGTAARDGEWSVAEGVGPSTTATRMTAAARWMAMDDDGAA